MIVVAVEEAVFFAGSSVAVEEEVEEKFFHLRQPSKSIRACMQPHSMILRSSQM